MTIRCGMSGDTVKRIEEQLSSLKLYSGPIDAAFGGGLEAAVKNYQLQKRLPASGAVDAATWSVLFPGEPTPVSELAERPLAERCLALTGSFETGKYPPDCFCGLTGDFDGMGMSFGALQWNIGQGSLQPLLGEMFEQHPDTARSIFNEHFETVKALRDAPLPDQLTFSRTIQVKGQVMEPWRGMLITLGRAAEYQQIQANHANRLYEQALALSEEYGLQSERAVALLFDVVTQNGSVGTIEKARILADYAQLPSVPGGNEVAKMRIIANRVAEHANAKYVDDVRTRKLAIANGEGTVHGIFYDLADVFNLTLNPYGKNAAAAKTG
jgi:Putative peptidoglycan binding domain